MASTSATTTASTTLRRIYILADDEEDDLQQYPRPRKAKKYKSMKEIMRKARRVEIAYSDEEDVDGDGDGGDDDDNDENDDKFSNVLCEQCGLGDKAEQLLLCDKCDRGFHMLCLRPIAVRVPIGSWYCPSCSGSTNSSGNLIKSTITSINLSQK